MSLTYKGRIEARHLGMSEDVRIQDFASYFFALHFDIFSQDKICRPFRDLEAIQTDISNQRIERIILDGVSGKFYGLGQVSSADTNVRIYVANADAAGLPSSWQAATTADGSTNIRASECFVLYRGFLVGFTDQQIWCYKLSTNTFTDSAVALSTETNRTNGLITSDGLLIMVERNSGAGNSVNIHVCNGNPDTGGNWSVTAIVPTDYDVVDLEEWGKYVALLATPLNPGMLTPKIFLWNKVDTDPSEVIDLGEGTGQIVANIDGELYEIITTKLKIYPYEGFKNS